MKQVFYIIDLRKTINQTEVLLFPFFIRGIFLFPKNVFNKANMHKNTAGLC